MMPRNLKCTACDAVDPQSPVLSRHCTSPSCPWMTCQTHGDIKLSGRRRRWLAGEGTA